MLNKVAHSKQSLTFFHSCSFNKNQTAIFSAYFKENVKECALFDIFIFEKFLLQYNLN